MTKWIVLPVAFLSLILLGQFARAQDDAGGERTPGTEARKAEPTERERKLADYLTGARFVGKFTVEGKDAPPKSEEYVISKCEKLPQENLYRFTARIKYGDVDSEVPMDLTVLWSGSTPVITLDRFWIPGMGTFSARVLIHSDRYAGTWQHDEVGGHLFGTIQKDDDDAAEQPAALGEP